MDPLLPLWLIIAGSICGGVIAGIVFERTTSSAAKRAAKFEADLVEARSDLMSYKQGTARHFGKSAELLGRMAGDYREFLDHFVGGAEELCGPNLKEINAIGLERPLLDSARRTAVEAQPAPMGSNPLAEEASPPK